MGIGVNLAIQALSDPGASPAQQQQLMQQKAMQEEQAKAAAAAAAQQQQQMFQDGNNELLDSLQGPDSVDQPAANSQQYAIIGHSTQGYRVEQPAVGPRPSDELMGPDDDAPAVIGLSGPAQSMGGVGVTQGANAASPGSSQSPGSFGTGNGNLQPNLNGPDEQMSAQARAPFDTPGGSGPGFNMQGSAVNLSGKQGIVNQTALQTPYSNVATIGVAGSVAEQQVVSPKYTCQDFNQLRERVKGFQEALRKLDHSAELDQADREEWTGVTEKALDDFKDQLWKSVISVGFDYLDESITSRLPDQVDRDLNWLETEKDPTLRLQQLKKIYRDGQMEAAVTRIVERDRWWVKKLNSASSVVDALDLADGSTWEKTTEGAAMALSATLDNKYVKEALGASYGKTFEWSKTALDVSYDLLAKKYSYQQIEQANKNSDDYLRAVKVLNSKMQATISQIKDLEQMDANGSPAAACQQASNE
ncbi:MAG: hypothetical protein WCD12_06000 [Candidatus Binatus sp.]|uniref:hypothetical protein n=2 Tax=Candidatus Binatus sp. TaxID=2811406 RepID=UPI003C7074C7